MFYACTMARPLRIEYEGALYHLTSRGDRRETIFEDDQDRRLFLNILGDVIDQMQWKCHGYCLMDNHYHLIIETPEANLSKGMRQLNGVFTQAANRRHGLCGHLFQGRFKSVVVDADAYLLELSRYVALNPVRAGMVDDPSDWPWSSYQATAGKAHSPAWLETRELLSFFSNQTALAQRKYMAFVAEGTGRKSIWSNINRQIFLGDDKFVAAAQAKVKRLEHDGNIPRVQRLQPARPLSEIAKQHEDRNVAIVACYASGEYSYAQIAKYFGICFTTVGRIVRKSGKMIQ